MDLLETHGNFVIATDKIAGKLAIFLIDEKDPENDQDKINVWEVEIQGTILAVTYVQQEEKGVVVAVSKNPFLIQTFDVSQTSVD